MTRASGFESRSLIELGIGPIPNEAPKEVQRWLGPVYNALNVLLDGLQVYGGIAQHSPPVLVEQAKGSQMHAGLNSRIYVNAGEKLGPGDVVAFLKLTTSEEIVAMKAKATASAAINPLAPVGIVTSRKSVELGTPIEVTCGVAIIRNIGGLTPGTTYYLAAEPGKIAPGNGVPFARAGSGSSYTWTIPVGVALAPTVLLMNLIPT